MGHKVNPVGMRIGVKRDWNSVWYASKKDYTKSLLEDMKIRKFLENNKKVQEAVLSHIEIKRRNTFNGLVVEIKIFVKDQAVIIGQDTANMEAITKGVKKIIGIKTRTRIDVVSVDKPDLDAHIVAWDLAKALEARASFRTAQKKIISRVRKAGAVGVKTLVGGRLGGADIARAEGYKEGTIPLHTLKSDIDFAVAEANTTYGKLGVKVWICRGNYKTKEELEAEAKAAQARPQFRDRNSRGGRR